MDTITVYTKPACVQCEATLRALDRLGCTYSTIDITADTDARDYLLARGFLAAPVVVAGGQARSGFRPDRIRGLAA